MDLTKIFVLVPSTSAATVESIKTVSLSNHKVYFMAKYNQIVAKGTVYGVDPSTGKELETLVSVLGGTKAADGTVSVNFSGLNYTDNTTIIGTIRALDAKIKSEMDKIAASKTLDENYEFTGQIRYVAASGGTAAHIALVDEDGIELSTVPVSDIIGNGVLKSSSYNKETGELSLTFAQASGVDKTETINLAEMLDINDVKVADGSTNYIGVDLTGSENSQAVFSIKVSKMADQDLTGLADAKDVKDYVDGKVAGKNVSAEGDTYVTATATDNKVTVAAQIGNMVFTAAQGGNAAKLEGVEGKLVDSKEAAIAIKGYADAVVAKEAADRATAITDAIETLDVPAVEKGNNVKVKISETDGKVALDSVVESYANVTRTNTASTAETPATNAAITVDTGDEDKLIKASDLKDVAEYAADKVTEEAHRVDKKIADLGGSATSDAVAGVTTTVTTSGGQVSGVVVSVADNAVTSDGDKNHRDLVVASEDNVIKGQAIAQIKDYVDNVVADNTADLTVDAAGDDYINAAVDAVNNKKINVTADVTKLTVTTSVGADSTLTGTAKSLADAGDVAEKVSEFVNARIDEEIKKLDVTEKTIGDSNVIIKYSEADGKVTASAEIKYAGVAYSKPDGGVASLTVENGGQLAKGNDITSLKQYVDSHVAEAIDALDSSVEKKDDSKFVAVKTVIADGKLDTNNSSVAVVYADHNAATAGKYSNGIATGDFVNSVLGDLWETYVG